MKHNVLFVNTPSYFSGAEISLLTLMLHLDNERYRPYLLTSSSGTLVEKVLVAGIPVLTLEFPWFSRRRPWRYMLSIAQLVRTIQTNCIDLVHTNCDHSLVYVMRACKLTRVPYVSHVRDFVRTWFQPEKVRALNRADCVIANSQAIADACRQAGVGPERLRVIYNPVDIQQFSHTSPREGGRFRQELSVPDESLLIGVVGQIHLLKGQKEFVLAATRLASMVPEAIFVVVGTALNQEQVTFEKRLWDMVVEMGLTSRFHFTGFRDDVPEVMRALDILVVPSHTESFGRVAVEGMSAGCAIVASASGGLLEIVEHSVDGLLVPPQDVDALVKAILSLCNDRVYREEIRQRGRQKARGFDVGQHVRQVQALYDLILRR